MLLVLFTVLIALPFSSAGDTVHWAVPDIIIDDPTVRFELEIFSPTAPDSYPMVIFLTGLNGLAPAFAYTQLMTTIAEQNIIAIALAKIENIKPEKMADHLTHFLDWVIKPDDGAARLFAEHREVKGVTPNTTRLAFLSHSAAAHPLGQYLNGTCGPIKLIIMMNPVDGIDPWGKIDDFITHPPNPLPFRTPALIISAGLDNVPVNKGFPACAPANMSNDRWYYSLYGPTFQVNFTDYGHADNLDEPVHKLSEAICTPCKGDICNFPQYKDDEGTLIATFIHAIFNRDVQQIQIIENPRSVVKTNITNKFDLHNYDYKTGGPGGFCTHD